MQRYDRAYFEVEELAATQSAAEIVPIICDALAPRSVVDLGCGVGAWLAAFSRHGAHTVTGIDGSYVDRANLLIPAVHFIAHDLTQPAGIVQRVGRRFDLAVSLEVAEHLPEPSAASFVATLAALAPAVVFSAAVPFQGGRNHINEQWPNYWARLFAEHGFATVDFLRPRIWGNTRVAFYYAQNMLLFIEATRLEEYQQLQQYVVAYDDEVLARVHPRKWLSANDYKRQSLRKLVKALPFSLRRMLQNRIGLHASAIKGSHHGES